MEYNPEISGRFAYIYRRADWCPDGELLSCPLDDPDGASVALPHRAGVQLEGLSLSRRYALVLERVDALPRLRVHELLEEGGLGEPVEVELPLEVCEVRIGDCGDFDSDVFRIAVTSTATPTTILDFHATNPNDKAVKRVTPVRGGFDSSKYKVERLNAPSRGGSETIPLTLTYRPDKTAWPTPCLLEVYGAYGANLDVSFSPNIISLLDRGVTLAQVTPLFFLCCRCLPLGKSIETPFSYGFFPGPCPRGFRARAPLVRSGEALLQEEHLLRHVRL